MAAVFAAGVVILFLCYLRVSQLLPVNSDGAANVLQAWDMLHGNGLLRGWTLSDVSFYTTELPQYALLELLLGFSPLVVHVAAAMTYTLLVTGAALLARGRATGAERWIRMAVAAGIMLAPQPRIGTYLLLAAPDHTGTMVPLLAAFLVLDRAPRRWWSAGAVLLLLTLAQIGDPLALIEGALPIAAVSAIRVYLGVARSRRLERQHWYDLCLAIGALVSYKVATAFLALIGSLGGFRVFPVPPTFSQMNLVPRHVWLAIQSVMALYGADFTGRRLGPASALTMLHLAGLALAVTAVVVATRRFFADDDRIAQVLVVSVILTLTVFVFSQRAFSTLNAREISGVLPAGAVLAGRVLAGRLVAARLMPPLAAVLAVYLVALGSAMVQKAAPDTDQQLASWLRAHHLGYGVASYWESNSVTLDSRMRVQVRYLGPLPDGRVAGADWESQRSWYEADQHNARFVIWSPQLASMRAVLATFGPPARTYSVDRFKVLVYRHNLLTDLHGTFVPAQVREDLPGY